MKNLKHLVLLLFFFLAEAVVAQTGTIRGTVIEDSSGEPLFGVTVQIKGTTNGAITDFDGKFTIKAASGTYELTASFVSFQTVTVSDLVVQDGEVTVIDQIRLKEDVELLDEVVVTAEVIKTTESALLTVKRKSANLIDGISSESFKKIGDGDAGQAARRVTGVSVEGGKYVYVRGLGDRYTKTTLNGMDIPGLDPDRNSIQIDVFPTNLIDNMTILKTFTPELPADFTGGIVNIETKDFPEEEILDVSLSIDFNPSMHFNNEYITYQGSNTDWLGFDNGERDFPSGYDPSDIPNPVDPSEAEDVGPFLQEFSPTMGIESATSFMDYSFSFTSGNQYQLRNGHSVGYLLTGNYKNTTKLYDDSFIGEYQNDVTDRTRIDFQRAFTQDGMQTEQNVLVGGLAGLAYKTDLSKYRITFLKLQNGESLSVDAELVDDEDATGKSGYTGVGEVLSYNERSITNLFVNGEHHLNNDSWSIDWRGAATWSSQDDPDIRRTAFTRINDNFRFAAGAAGNPSRLWRELEETNLVGKVDLINSLEVFERDAKLKFGASHTFKERFYSIVDLNVNFLNGQQLDWNGEGLEVWTDETLYPQGSVFLVSGFSDPNPNEYEGNTNNTSAYFSAELSPTKKLKGIIGVRAENFVMRHTGRDQEAAGIIRSAVDAGEDEAEVIADIQAGVLGGKALTNDIVLDELDFFPSVSLIYALQEKQNLRFSYSKTIARPSFKELSFAQIFDPISNRIFNGGLFAIGSWDGNLLTTDINNIDFRWEIFMNRGQTYSVSAFYKTFANPIELVRIPQQRTNVEYQPRNVGDGQLFGMEFEFRKSLDFISPEWSANGNFTVVQSSIKMQEDELTNRRANAREGEEVDDTRNMEGQAPWIINAGLQYSDFSTGLDAGLFYNVKGQTLTVVGGGLDPDVFVQPFHSLNFNLNKTLGAKQQWALNAGVSNILNDKREWFYKRAFSNFEDSSPSAVYEQYSPGMAFSLGAKYSF